MPTFFEKVEAPPKVVDRSDRNKIQWQKEEDSNAWHGYAFNDDLVAFCRPINQFTYRVFYIGLGRGAGLERPSDAILDEAKAWAQERHNEALAAQVEQLLEKGTDL